MPQPTTRPTPQRPWTEDTRTAFLLALRLTGGVRAAAAEIGRSAQSAYEWREREAGFAAAWDAIVAAQRAARRTARIMPDAMVRDGRAVPVPELDAANQRKRRDGLTALKQRAFLRGLTETGTLEGACRLADVSNSAVYKLRKRDADFAAAWDRALRVSAPALEQVAYERAVEGWEEPVFAGGKQVGTRWRHAPQLLKHLIDKRDKAAALADDPKALRARAEETARAAGGFFETETGREETNAAIMRGLAKIEKRIATQARRDAVAEAERLLALGLVP